MVDCLQGQLNIIRLQLPAYHLAVKSSVDADLPKNLYVIGVLAEGSKCTEYRTKDNLGRTDRSKLWSNFRFYEYSRRTRF